MVPALPEVGSDVEWVGSIANASGWAAAVSVLIFIIRAIAREDLVAGSTHRQTIKREEFWRDRALAGTDLAEAATDAAEKAADVD